MGVSGKGQEKGTYSSLISLNGLYVPNILYLLRGHSLPAVRYNSTETGITEWPVFHCYTSPYVPVRSKGTGGNLWILWKHISLYQVGFFCKVVFLFLCLPQLLLCLPLTGLHTERGSTWISLLSSRHTYIDVPDGFHIIIQSKVTIICSPMYIWKI